MSTKQTTVDFILEQMAEAGAVSAKRMFGEFGIFLDGRMAALVCDDQLFVKPTAGGRAFLGAVTEGCPYPGAKLCLLIPGDRWEDRAWLSRLIAITAAELPLPKPKARRKTRPKAR